MEIIDKILTVGDLRKKIENLDDNIELDVLITSDEYPYIPHYPVSAANTWFKVDNTEDMKQIGPIGLCFFPITPKHIEANPNSYSQNIKDKIAKIIAPHICKIKQNDTQRTKEVVSV